MQLFAGECAKVFLRRSFLLALAALLVLNGFLLWRNEITDKVSPNAVRALYSDLAKLSDSEQGRVLKQEKQKLQALRNIEYGGPLTGLTKEQEAEYRALYKKGGYLKYTNYIFSEEQLYSDTLEEYNRIHNYDNYLKSIDTKAEQMRKVSIFSKPDSFDYRNIQKTAAEMASLRGRKLTFSLSGGANMATSFAGTDIIVVLLLFAICLRLVTFEKEKGLCTLTRTTPRGRARLMGAKIGTVAASALVLLILFYAVNFAVAGWVYGGFGDLSRTLQSVKGYNGSALKLTVGQYLVLYLASKYVAYLLAGLVLLLLCTLARGAVTAYALAVAVFGVEYALYAIISQYGTLGIFKCINLICFLFVSPLYKEYLNLNLFGFPVNVLVVLPIAVPVLVIAMAVLCVYTYSVISAMPRAHSQRFQLPRPGASVHVSNHEWHKLLIPNRALLLLVALIAVQGYALFHYSSSLSEDDVYYRGYMLKLAGPVTQQKVDFLKQEKARFDKLDAAQATLSQQYAEGKLTLAEFMRMSQSLAIQSKGKMAFQQVMERYNYLKKSKRPLSFVYDGGYYRLLGLDGIDDGLMDALILVIAIIGCFAGVFAIEYKNGAAQLIRAYPKGRGVTARIKMLQCLVTLIPIFVLCYAPDLVGACREYGIVQLSAPAASIPEFSAMPDWMTLLGVLCLFYSARLIAAVCCALIVLALSLYTRSSLATLISSLVLFAGPILLSMLGFPLLDAVTLNALLCGFRFISQSGAVSAVQAVIPVVLAVAAAVLTILRYTKTGSLLKKSKIKTA